MSWKDRAGTEFKITMAGIVFRPKSFNAVKTAEFNSAEHEFRNLSGTFVERKRPKGTLYNIELYFEGAQCIEDALRFQKASNNERRWEIEHPFYGLLKVQPVSPVIYDNSNNLLNVTKITCTVRESLTATDVTFGLRSPEETTIAAQAEMVSMYAEYYVTAVPIPSTDDINMMRRDVNKFRQALTIVSNGANDLINAYNQANANINNAIANVRGAIQSIQYYLSLPAFIAETVLNRLIYLADMLETIIDDVLNLSVTPLKSLWLTECSTIISAMCVCTTYGVTEDDYRYASQVTVVIGRINRAYSRVITNYFIAQSYSGAIPAPPGSTPNPFFADDDGFLKLDDLVGYTIANLYQVLYSSKQPQVLTLSTDSNIIQVAFKIYGLLPDDSTIDKIVADNDIYGYEILQLPKGRQIVYYL